MAGRKIMIGVGSLLLLFSLLCFSPAVSKPIVDPGLFVIQGVSSCINGTGYCIMGDKCTVDVDFLPDTEGGHCKGLRTAFTPNIDFICCRYNPLGKATSKPPTTTINSYTITDVFSLIDAEVAQHEGEDEIPEDINPENVIDIVGVVTDFTGIVGLVTRPWTGTFPTKATTTPITPSGTPSTTPASPFPLATPLDIQQAIVELQTEGTVTETPSETTENYNEIPTEMTGPSVSNQQLNKDPEVTTSVPFTSHKPLDETESEEIEDEEDGDHEDTHEGEGAQVMMGLVNEESTHGPLSSSSSSSSSTSSPLSSSSTSSPLSSSSVLSSSSSVSSSSSSSSSSPSSTSSVSSSSSSGLSPSSSPSSLTTLTPELDSTSTPLPSTFSTPATTSSPVTSGYWFDENAIIFPDNPIIANLPLLETEALEAETETIINALLETLGSSSVQGSLEGSASQSGAGGQQGVSALNEIQLGMEHLAGIFQQQQDSAGAGLNEIHEQHESAGSVPNEIHEKQQESEGTGLFEIHQQQQDSASAGLNEIPEQQQDSASTGLADIHQQQQESAGAGLLEIHQQQQDSASVGLVDIHQQQEDSAIAGLFEMHQQHQESTDTADPLGILEEEQQESAGAGFGEVHSQEAAEDAADYEYAYDYSDHQHLLQPVNKHICGFKGSKNYFSEGSSSRILGGTVATTVEWCWVAAIMERRRSGDRYVCSAALIESDLVITTATCLKKLKSRDVNKFIVVLGDSNLQEDLPYGIQFHRIREVVSHPDYFTSGGAHANDVGVVRLRDHATLSDNVCLVCLTQQDAIFPAQSCTVAGYGIGDVPKNMLREVRDTVPSEGVLRQMSVPIMKGKQCEASLHNITGSEILATSESFLCAGGLDGGNACYSTMDGGSPLACEVGGRWFLAGVVSWTRDCERQDVPNVYTRVSSFSNWVQATHLRMLGFLTHQVHSQQVRWIQERVDKINKEFS
ncbi:uncharacterized protein [Palaemon carinicauda]|uniref:uncharacterized protein isoform X2 n=1 Tax=Palaemon carinicauda TaxID=392227 RepID=UPI0035B5CE04